MHGRTWAGRCSTHYRRCPSFSIFQRLVTPVFVLASAKRSEPWLKIWPEAGELTRAWQALLRHMTLTAPDIFVEAVRAAVMTSFEDGMAVENRLFGELVLSSQSASKRHLFFAERAAAKVTNYTSLHVVTRRYT